MRDPGLCNANNNRDSHISGELQLEEPTLLTARHVHLTSWTGLSSLVPFARPFASARSAKALATAIRVTFGGEKHSPRRKLDYASSDTVAIVENVGGRA